MNSFEFELWIEQYKAIIKKTGERALFPDEIAKLDDNIDDYMPEEYENAYTLAKQGDYSKFEKLPHLLRNYLGAKALEAFRAEFGDTPSLEDERVRQYLEKNAMNAALRAGISAEKNSEKTRESAKALDLYMNNILMKRTMMPPSEIAQKNLKDHYGPVHTNTELEKNMAKQLVLAKSMLLAQIGKYEVIDKNGLSKDLDAPVYETLVHGNRTNFVLPVGKDSQAVLDSFMGDTNAEIEKRTAATHSVKRRSIDKNGNLSSESKEERTYSPLKVFRKQYGMNIAVGGIGEMGPNKEIILGKGEAGHMYMRAEEGDAKHCGSLLIGIEGSAPSENSYLGNEHGITAKSAKQSAFLADKSIVGKKVGGRQIDLSGISAADLTDILNQFSQKYSDLQRGADTPAGREKLSALNDMLMGKRMDINKLMEMFDTLGMADERLKDVVSNARKGYLSKINVGAISVNEFAQSIRAKFSQEKACAIAEARLAYAGNDLALGVGAIKELMLTHETRSLGWKLRHPIKNYREKATISDLTKRLVLVSPYSRAQIANEFVRESDSFTMDWGESLSNDRDAIQFLRENKQNFKISEHTVLDVLKKNYSDQIKDATPIAESENSNKLKEELQKVFVERAKKEHIVISEESEINKTTQKTSEPVVLQQPRKENQKGI